MAKESRHEPPGLIARLAVPSRRRARTKARATVAGDLMSTPAITIGAEIVHEVFEHELGMTVTPATVIVRVHDGVVRLSGELEYRGQIPAAVALARRVDGVIDVVAELTWLVDDRHGRPVGPDTTDVLAAVRRTVR